MASNKEHKERRITASCVEDLETGRFWVRGTETADRDRANVFGEWQDWDEDEPLRMDFDDEGDYMPASVNCRIGVEVEVRFALESVADDDPRDYAEVYIWDAYTWKLSGEELICTRDETFWGDYLYQGGPLHEAIIFSPLVAQAAWRIHNARFNYEEFEPRQVGNKTANDD